MGFVLIDQDTQSQQPPREPVPAVKAKHAAESRTPAVPVAMVGSRPVSISIPSLDVRSPVGALGQKADGTVEVPAGDSYDDVGWYKYSPTPGSIGPAVMLGHIDSKARGPSVFYHLGEIKRGARISVKRADASVAIFTVDRVGRFAKKQFPTQAVYGNIDHAGLRLVTCGGEFDSDAKSYVDNIVVFASLTGSTRPA